MLPVIDLQQTGAKIKSLREAAGMSIIDLQNAFGFNTPQAIYKWQRGDALPTIDNMIGLSYIFNVPIDNIIVCRK